MSINNKNKARVDLRNRMEIAEGNKTQEDAKYSPSYVSTINSAPVTKHPDKFDRPADPRTESKFRVQQYMEDERNKKQTDEFMEFFNNPKFGQE